jgi:hypothetical protein
MATWNRAAQREADAKIGKGLKGSRGEYWRISGMPGGRYVLRFLPPHPQRNPEGLLYRPKHWLEKTVYGCNRRLVTPDGVPAPSAPDGVLAKVGPDCVWCDCVEYWRQLNDENSYQYEILIPNPKVREMIGEMAPTPDTHGFVIIIEEAGRPSEAPNPKHAVFTAISVLRILDDEGMGRSPEAMMLLTDPQQGRNLVIQKKSKEHYGVIQWDFMATPLSTYGVTPEILSQLMSPAKYPDLRNEGKDSYKTYEEGSAILKSMGMML